MAINLILSIAITAGLYFLYSRLVNRPLLGGERQTLAGDGKEGKRTAYFVRLEMLLYQAHAPISVAEFLGISLVIGLIIGAGIYFAMGASLVAVLLIPVGGLVYYLWLQARRETSALLYENAQVQVAYVLAGAFRSEGLNLDKAIQQVLINGPEIAREDWQTIRAALASQPMDYAAINQVLNYRNSPGLSKIIEAIRVNREQIKHLPAALIKLRAVINRETATARENASGLRSGKRRLLYMTAFPVVAVVMLTLFNQGLRDFYSSFIGQMLLTIVFGFIMVIYNWASGRAASASRVRPYVVTFPEGRTGKAFDFAETIAAMEEESPGLGNVMLEDLPEPDPEAQPDTSMPGPPTLDVNLDDFEIGD